MTDAAGVEMGAGFGGERGGVARRFLFDLAWLGHGGSVAEPPRRSTRVRCAEDAGSVTRPTKTERGMVVGRFTEPAHPNPT